MALLSPGNPLQGLALGIPSTAGFTSSGTFRVNHFVIEPCKCFLLVWALGSPHTPEIQDFPSPSTAL